MMSKELEALKEVKDFISDIQCGTCHSNAMRYTDSFIYLEQNAFSIIETALKRLEIYDNVEKKIEETTPNKCILNDDGSIEIEGADYLMLVPKKEYQKKVKALKIIKEKKVDAAIFFEKSNSVRHRKQLTQQEYDLLKEVLL